MGEAFRGEVSAGRVVAKGGSAWPPARSQMLLFLDKSFYRWPGDPRVFLTLEERQMWKEKLCLILNAPTSGVFPVEKIINGIEQMTEGETIDQTSKIAVLLSTAGL